MTGLGVERRASFLYWQNVTAWASTTLPPTHPPTHEDEIVGCKDSASDPPADAHRGEGLHPIFSLLGGGCPISHGQATSLPQAQIPIRDHSWGLEGRGLFWWGGGEGWGGLVRVLERGASPRGEGALHRPAAELLLAAVPRAHCHFLAVWTEGGAALSPEQAGKRAPVSSLLLGAGEGGAKVWVVPRGGLREAVILQECGSCTWGSILITRKGLSSAFRRGTE